MLHNLYYVKILWPSLLKARRTDLIAYGAPPQQDWTWQAAVATEEKGFIGERYDEEAGLSYLNARCYDPALGRFIHPDG
ncbi:RHS repeat-associated core domain-containing protein [Halovulum sp. GXIMD14793]